MLRDVSVHNTKLVIDFLNSHEELFTREAARYATEKMNPRDKSQVKLFDKAVQRRGRSANRKETEQDAKEATEESSLVESEDSLYKGECEAYKDALNVLRWNCGYPLPEDVLSGNVRYGLSEKIEKNIENEILESIEIAIKYKGYIDKALRQVEKMKKMEEKQIPLDINYEDVLNLSLEAKQKLSEIRPLTIAQASRISGINPADISVLLIHLKQNY